MLRGRVNTHMDLGQRTGRTCRRRGLAGDERGMVVIAFAVAMAAVVGLSALSLDSAKLFGVRHRLINVADAAALAGGQLLPEDPAGAVQAAREYVARNGLDPDRAEVTVWRASQRITVTLHADVPLNFGPAVGMSVSSLGSDATAETGMLHAVRGAQPWGMEDPGDLELGFGELYTIKLSASGDGGTRGNFQALALGGTGADNYRDNIINGFPGLLARGDVVDTEPGDMRGPTRQGLRYRLDADPDATWTTVVASSPRIVVVPVVSSFKEASGRSVVRVLGFGAFFLEDVQGNQVVGRFLRLVVDGEPGEFGSGKDYGPKVVRLID